MAQDFAAWFLGKPTEQPFEQGTSSRRRRRLSPEPQAQPSTEPSGTEYAAQYVEKEIQSCLQVRFFSKFNKYYKLVVSIAYLTYFLKDRGSSGEIEEYKNSGTGYGPV